MNSDLPYRQKQRRKPLKLLMIEVLQDAGKPLTINVIHAKVLEKGYVWRTKDPYRAIFYSLTSSRIFKRSAPGMFELREGERPGSTCAKNMELGRIADC